jgi:hypothetical protein
MVLERSRCAAVGELCGVFVEVDTAMPDEGVAAAGVGEDFSEFVAGEGGNDLSLPILRDIFVLFGQMHHQGILDIPSLIEMFLGVAAVEDHRGISAATSGREKGHQTTQAIAHQADLATGAG